MLVRIDNVPRRYAWGSRSRLAEFLGRPPSGAPEAEIWFGAHASCPSRVLGRPGVAALEYLDEVVRLDPEGILGPGRQGTEFPFLLKALAADSPLSIQVHPNASQASAGFFSENGSVYPDSGPERLYRDARGKPELALAVDDGFELLVGFRPRYEAVEVLGSLIASAHGSGSTASTLEMFRDLVASSSSLSSILSFIFDSPEGGIVADVLSERLQKRVPLASSFSASLRALARVASAWPGDRGVAVALLLNHLCLNQGQSVYIPPGVVHSYLRGFAVELMTSSDNVIRGGLTRKRVDSREFRRIASLAEGHFPVLEPILSAQGFNVHFSGESDFQLAVVEPTGADCVTADIIGPAIALGLEGRVDLVGEYSGSVSVARGQAILVSPEEGRVSFRGRGRIVFASESLVGVSGV